MYNTTGNNNTGIGFQALRYNSVGSFNPGIGTSTLMNNSTGQYNTAIGFESLTTNGTGEYNTATGANALHNNSFGESNTGNGVSALRSNTSGHYNTATGVSALRYNTTGVSNTASGYRSLYTNTSGGNNTALGYEADVITGSLSNSTAIGANAKVTASNTIQLGDQNVVQVIAGTTNSTKLVAGGLQVKGGSPGIGKVLVSDAAGNATWQIPGGGSWVVSGSNINYSLGGVSIGTSILPANYKMAVAGKNIAEEIVVKLQNTWPDYVFEEDYKLLSLEKLQLFISQHKHLPGIPTATEVKANGVSVGEMNTLLLKKIEELTLHVIELKGEIDQLKSR
jgi:hypothetical protein